MQLPNKKIIILIISLVIIIIILFVINSSLNNKKTILPNRNLLPSPTNILITPIPSGIKTIQAIPTLSDQQGGGVDTHAAPVIASEQEIQKLASVLPYTSDITLSTGITASVVIPSLDLQNNAWTLKVQIFGINYETSPDQQDYTVMKQSFLEAANDVFTWAASNGVDPKKIYVVWGDKAYIQNIAERWLNGK